MAERLFSTYQIAKLLGTTLSSVAQWMDDGSMNFCRMPDGAVRITESDLIEFLTEQGIDLGEVLAKAGYTKLETVGSTSDLLPQAVSVGAADADDDATDAAEPPEPVDEEPDPTDDQEAAVDSADDDATDAAEPPEPIDDEPDPTDDQEAAVESAEDDEASGGTSAEQLVETARPDLRAEQICDAILADAARHGAQTIHLTPNRDHLVLQLRTGSMLRNKLNFDRHLPDGLRHQTIACMLNRANPDIDSETLTVPLSAEFTQTIDGQDLTLRLSALPTVHGPRLVIHMPPPAADLESLALEDAAHTRLEKLLQVDGLILVAAKRRTGRDMTLRALLNAADTNGRSAIAVERNSAPDLDNVVQVQINPAAGLTYAAAMAAMEHQDADAIVLTELRDPATAIKAFDAAHDGALVIAGINANSASEAITELLAMGLEPWPLGGTLKAIVEQGARTDTTPPSSVTFVEGQLVEVIRHGGTAAQRDQAIAQGRQGHDDDSV